MRIIKRYSNRKLYDTTKAGYVTLGALLAIVRTGEEVRVICHDTDVDLTSETLTLGIHQEQKGAVKLPAKALHRLIREGLPA